MIRDSAPLGFAAALALAGLALLAPAAGAAPNVVTCDPTDGVTSTVVVKPAQVNNVSPDAAYGFDYKTTLDGCVANAAQLSAWIPSKNGTPNGALIDKAAMRLKAKGFGTCNLLSPTAAAYPPNGKLQVKWLDSTGKAVAKTRPSSAYVQVSIDLVTISAAFDSAASLFEVAIKAALPKRDFDADIEVLRPALAEMGFLELAVTGAHAERLAALPLVHRDPFDRMLIAQCLTEPLVLLTARDSLDVVVRRPLARRRRTAPTV